MDEGTPLSTRHGCPNVQPAGPWELQEPEVQGFCFSKISQKPGDLWGSFLIFHIDKKSQKEIVFKYGAGLHYQSNKTDLWAVFSLRLRKEI